MSKDESIFSFKIFWSFAILTPTDSFLWKLFTTKGHVSHFCGHKGIRQMQFTL